LTTASPSAAPSEKLLAARGFEPLDAVPDGEATLASVPGDCLDGILPDISLPRRDGFAVAASTSSLCAAAGDRADLTRYR